MTLPGSPEWSPRRGVRDHGCVAVDRRRTGRHPDDRRGADHIRLCWVPRSLEDGFVVDTWTTVIGPGGGRPGRARRLQHRRPPNWRRLRAGRATLSGIGDGAVAGVGAAAGRWAGWDPAQVTEPDVLDNQLIIRSMSPVFIERSLRREPGAQGRVGSGPSPSSAERAKRAKVRAAVADRRGDRGGRRRRGPRRAAQAEA